MEPGCEVGEVSGLACRAEGDVEETNTLYVAAVGRSFNKVAGHRHGGAPQLRLESESFLPWKPSGNVVHAQHQCIGVLEHLKLRVISAHASSNASGEPTTDECRLAALKADGRGL